MSENIKKKALSACLIACMSVGFVGCGDDDENNQQPQKQVQQSVQEEQTSAPSEKAEKKEPLKFNEDAVYKNNKTASYDYGDGTITVGLSNGPDGKAVYLNPHCSEASTTSPIGYYLESSRVNLQYSTESAGITANVGYNEGKTDFVIVDRFYSDVIPANYVDEENYGVRWADDKLKDGKNDGTTIAIRAVNLNSGELVALCDVVIKYDEENNAYFIESIKSSDVKDNKELDDESRANLVAKAAEFAAERLHEDVGDFNNSGAIVDKHDGTYFAKFLDEDDSILYYKDYTTCADTYVVNIPSATYGFVSVYFAPQTQLIGLTSPTEPGKTDLKLKLYGYDPVKPYDMNTLVAPDGFLR